MVMAGKNDHGVNAPAMNICYVMWLGLRVKRG